MDLIYRKQFENQIFVQCDCGEEIIEFCRDSTLNEDGSVEYFIRHHGYFNPKIDKYSGFYFATKADLSLLLDEMRDFLNKVEKNKVEVIFDKYLTYKDKKPGVLVALYDNDFYFFNLIKYPNYKEAIKIGKCSWEIILRKEQVEQLLKELEEWR